MIDFDKFLAWAEDRFAGDVVVKGKEIKINSIFKEDSKHHLWCNPSGGKKDREFGVYHCWKTDRKGSLVSLVMEVDKCTYEDALDVLGAGDLKLREMEELLETTLFGNNNYKIKEIPFIKNEIDLPTDTHLITDLSDNDYYKASAELHLKERKIPIEGLYVCKSGVFRDRIIIPYYNKQGAIFYYNGRYFGSLKNQPKYLGPPKEIGISKEDVIYFPEWPLAGDFVYITEGEFNAKSIQLSGLKSAALGGKAMSVKQMQYLKECIPVIAFDNDSPGYDAVMKTGLFLLQNGFAEIYFVRPPKGFKDWNKMLETLTPSIIRKYLSENKKMLSEWSYEELKYQKYEY